MEESGERTPRMVEPRGLLPGPATGIKKSRPGSTKSGASGLRLGRAEPRRPAAASGRDTGLVALSG